MGEKYSTAGFFYAGGIPAGSPESPDNRNHKRLMRIAERADIDLGLIVGDVYTHMIAYMGVKSRNDHEVLAKLNSLL